MARIQSVEPNIADLANGWLKSYGLDYKLEQESLNSEIDRALDDYFSKSGGQGGNRPDVKLLLENPDRPGERWPILIEYKGYKGKLVKLNDAGNVANTKQNNSPHYTNIKNYAVNGAVHYANALLHHTSYTDIIAIGMTGWKDESEKLNYEIGVWYVSKSNLGIGQKVGEYTDFSFLRPEHFDDFIERVKHLQLTQEELDALRVQREREIDASLTQLNNDIYKEEKGLSESDRVHLVAGTIMATLGIPGKVAPLEKSDLKSSREAGNTDGDIVMRKIEAFLGEKGLPEQKRDLIVRTLKNTLLAGHVNRVVNGETQLKRVFCKIVDDLGIYYKIGLSTDFTGKLFNEMYNWLGFSQDKMNDVVLTPAYVASLLVRLARVNRNSYVWDFATGSAGLLVAAMNEMLADARENIGSPEELRKKEAHIKAHQLLGLEILPSVYMLAVLNMILMGDGSSNILNEDSLRYFEDEEHARFPADAFVLNPPYSAPGCGMVFVEKALEKMQRGYAAVIIQSSAGSGKAVEYNRRILRHSTLIASIKMPDDLFVGKSSVQTRIYVFRAGEPHQPDDVVKFIDFSNDGYTRSNRKKARTNLRDTDRAMERYDELVKLVRFGRSKLNIFTEREYYEGVIDPDNGADWNQTAPVDITPTLEDFKKTVGDYLAWEVEQILRGHGTGDEQLGKTGALLDNMTNVEWGDFKLGDLFGNATRGKRLKSEDRIPGDLPFVTAGEANQGVSAFIGNDVRVFPANTVTIDMFGSAKYRGYEYGADDHVAVVHTDHLPKNAVIFIASAIHKAAHTGEFHYGRNFYAKDADSLIVRLPTKNGKPDYDLMEHYIEDIERVRFEELHSWLTNEGFDNYDLTDVECQGLEDFKKGRITWGEFSLGDIFNHIRQGKRLKKEDQEPGRVPFVMAGTSNMGVANYVANPVASFPANAITVDIFGNVFYRGYAFGAGDDTGVYWSESEEATREVMLFYAAAMNRALAGRFSYGCKLRSSRSHAIVIKLPVQSGYPDYALMEVLISAIRKLVVQDVVDYVEQGLLGS